MSVDRIGLFSVRVLVEALLREPWQRVARIVPNYMPPYPNKDTRPACVVYYPPTDAFLRYSHGPMQGYFWDAYGDDFGEPEWALIALTRAPAPLGRPYVEWTTTWEPAPEVKP